MRGIALARFPIDTIIVACKNCRDDIIAARKAEILKCMEERIAKEQKRWFGKRLSPGVIKDYYHKNMDCWVRERCRHLIRYTEVTKLLDMAEKAKEQGATSILISSDCFNYISGYVK